MKSLMLLWQVVLQDLGDQCHTSTAQDLKTALGRFEHEGCSFLTITLPTFGKDLEKGLDQGFVDRNLFTGFRRKGELPRFLGGFLDRVFDRCDGRLLQEPDVFCIFAVRQLTLMFGKILLPCSDARTEAAYRGYLQCEKDIRESDISTPRELLLQFERVSLLLWADILSSLDRNIYEGDVLVPKHGPGATADRLRGNAKYDQREWTHRLESIFPFGDHAIPNWRFNYLLDRTVFLEPGAERPVRVITVPKTLKTPRIIAVEPTCMQYMQQAISENLVNLIEEGPCRANGGFSPRDMIGFDDQVPNQHMAREGSLWGNLATLDLSEASDRVSNQLVRTMLRRFPHVFEAVDACRSRKADVLGKEIRLAKFASMGSALTFPVEAMVFLTVAFMGVEKGLNRPLTRADIKAHAGKVRVYGDDIIIPVDCVYDVIQYLEAFGFKINKDKSFWNGKFRESCGKDYYDGIDVSICRVRRVFPTSRRDVSELVSMVSLRNQLYYAGLWGTVQWLDDRIRKLLRHYPVVATTSSAIGRHSFLGYDNTQKWDDDLHKPLVKAWVIRTREPASKASGEGALLKMFLKRGFEPFANKEHLERFGRPDAVDIKLRWVSPV